MAANDKSQTETVELKTGDLPKSEYKSFNVIPPTFNQSWTEKCLLNGIDQRKIKLTEESNKAAQNALQFIGHLKVRIGNSYGNGTAFVFAFENGSVTDGNFLALTAAHCVCYVIYIIENKHTQQISIST